MFVLKLRFLLLLFVTFLEFVDTTCSINQNFLAGKEGVRRIRNFEFYKGIIVTIFPFHCFFCGGRRTAQETMPVTHIFENYEPIILGMKSLFHNTLIFKLYAVLNWQK